MSALRGRRVEGEVITGAQIKAARKLLGWTRAELAVRAFGVSSHTVEGAERVGELNHRGASYPAEHAPIVTPPCSMQFRRSSRPIATENE